MWGHFRLTAVGRRDEDLSYWQPSADTDYPLRVLGNAASVHGDYIFCNDGTLWQLRHLYTDEELEDLDWDDDIPRERVVKILDNVKSLEESRVDGRNYFAAICEDGSLWMWGDNQYGQLGTGDCNNRNEPVKVMDNGIRDIVYHVGKDHAHLCLLSGIDHEIGDAPHYKYRDKGVERSLQTEGHEAEDYYYPVKYLYERAYRDTPESPVHRLSEKVRSAAGRADGKKDPR